MTAIEKIPGKFYVLDQFSTDGQPISGPFDTKAEAEKDRREWNCADDYFVGKYTPKQQPAAQ
jgi:hypothetical protein